MAVKIITGEDGEQVLYCSSTMQAFGPVHDHADFAYESFLEWLPMDARDYSQEGLTHEYFEWLKHMENEN